MNFKIIIEQKAEEDIKKAAKWYFDQSETASENFKKEVYNTFSDLQTSIIQHRKFAEEIRMFSLKVFPYNIYYIKSEEQNKIFIVAVLHHKRDFTFINKRLNE